MSITKHVPTLASAALLALVVVSVPTSFAHASIVVDDGGTTTSGPQRPTGSTQARQKSPAQLLCEARGHTWISGQCADKKCYHNGTWYNPASTRQDGEHLYACDGVDGTWVQIYRGHAPTGNAPTPGTNAPTGSLAPQGPYAPVTIGPRAQ